MNGSKNTRMFAIRISLICVCLMMVMLLAACWILEPRAPSRNFGINELLVFEPIKPSWLAMEPFFPEGDDLCTTECTTLQFVVPDREPPIQASQDIYRYLSSGIARRTFDYVYLHQANIILVPVEEWNFNSSLATAISFGCHDWDGRDTPVCEWAGLYEEYIVVYWIRMTPGEVTIQNVKDAVILIDRRMEQFLQDQ